MTELEQAFRTSDHSVQRIFIAELLSQPLIFGNALQIEAKRAYEAREAVRERLAWFKGEDVQIDVTRRYGQQPMNVDRLYPEEIDTLCSWFAWMEGDDNG